MNILIYCQHILGVGHLFRTVAIARAMGKHRVTLVLGGPPAEIELPDHVQLVQLPGLRMDEAFSKLFPVESGRSLEEVKAERSEMLKSLADVLQPDVVIIELFPFGRNGFSFELIPLLEACRKRKKGACRVVCSLRDILVEKKDQARFEQRVIDRLNSLFDLLLIHGDPRVIPLDATFSRMQDINIPVIYTGYICERCRPGGGTSLRRKIKMKRGEKLIVVSAGGGSVGTHLLQASFSAFDKLTFPVRMHIFTGPYLQNEAFDGLIQTSPPGVVVEQFSDIFPTWLAAADLSISMGGYNTTINVLAAGCPALILPFDQNREQRMRAERLASLAPLTVLDEDNLSPAVLADQISVMIDCPKHIPDIQLDGAAETNRWLTQLSARRKGNG